MRKEKEHIKKSMLFPDQDSSSAFAVFSWPTERQREVDKIEGEMGRERQIDSWDNVYEWGG